MFMRSFLPSLMTLVVAVALVGCSTCGSSGASSSQEEIPLGGLIQVDPEEEGVQTAARDAIRLLNAEQSGLELTRVVSAATQVVGLTNYSMRLECTRNGETELWDVVVNENVEHQFSLLSSNRVEGE
jgi:hypothetical protein